MKPNRREDIRINKVLSFKKQYIYLRFIKMQSLYNP